MAAAAAATEQVNRMGMKLTISCETLKNLAERHTRISSATMGDIQGGSGSFFAGHLCVNEPLGDLEQGRFGYDIRRAGGALMVKQVVTDCLYTLAGHSVQLPKYIDVKAFVKISKELATAIKI